MKKENLVTTLTILLVGLTVLQLLLAFAQVIILMIKS